MTSADLNDLVPAQEKLEWVTAKISLMGAEETEGAKPQPTIPEFTTVTVGQNVFRFGPS